MVSFIIKPTLRKGIDMIKAILFDWGNTVMEEFPGEFGPMADWLQVAVTPGFKEIFPELQSHYILCLATNSTDSSSDQVQKALAQAGLGGVFQNIYTAHDLGMAKPALEYYQKITTDLSLLPEQCLMVGDSFEIDANGAALAGLKTCWFMRSKEPLRSQPLFDGVITAYNQFPQCLRMVAQGNIPSFTASLYLLRTVQIKPGLFRHVQTVALIAFVLGTWLLESGVSVNPVLAHRAALLHDIDKGVPNRDVEEHGKLGARMVRDAGYDALYEAIYRHQVLNILEPETAPQSLEAKIVFLADKLVEKDQFVGVEVRLTHLIERHPLIAESLRRSLPLVLELEQEIANRLEMDSTQLEENLSRAAARVDLEDWHL